LLEQYPKDVKIVHKNFPLRSHKFARRAAIAAMAAHEQGKFWPFQDKIFENYNKLNEKKIQDIAAEVGLDLDKFKKDMTNPRIIRSVTRDSQDGSNAGVRGTPAIFVNGRLLRNRSLAGFKAIIEKELMKVK
jgi:protein-disulfide isomerase